MIRELLTRIRAWLDAPSLHETLAAAERAEIARRERERTLP